MAKRRISADVRRKQLTARRRSLARRNKALPEELQKKVKPRKKTATRKRRRVLKPRVSQYAKLGELIKKRRGPDEIKLSFMEMEEVLQRKLPGSARRYKAWWANNRSAKATSRHSNAWMDNGYIVTDVDFKKGVVSFQKARAGKNAVPYAAMLVKAARTLSERGEVTFSRKQLFAQAARLYSRTLIHLRALNPVIQAMTARSKSARMVAGHWRGTFKRVARGSYQLTDKGLVIELARPRAIKIKGKTAKTRLRYFLKAEHGWNLAPGLLPLGPGIPDHPFDLVSDNKKVAVAILDASSLRKRERGKRVLFETLYALEHAPAKKKLLVVEERGRKMQLSPAAMLIKTYRSLIGKGVDVYRYQMAPNPEKDQMLPIE